MITDRRTNVLIQRDGRVWHRILNDEGVPINVHLMGRLRRYESEWWAVCEDCYDELPLSTTRRDAVASLEDHWREFGGA